jgi:ATP/maltotriose-dependent transcriptional regulator MalT
MGLYTLAGVALARGQAAEAEELLTEVEIDAVPQHDPFRARALFRLADLRRIQGRPEEAEACVHQAIKVFEHLGTPDHPLLSALQANWAGG